MTKLHIAKKVLLTTMTFCALAVPFAAGLLNLGSGAAMAQGNEPYLPIAPIAPVYPVAAVARRLEGYVIVEFTVTETGEVSDPYVVETTSVLFDQAAIDAVLEWKYPPKLVDGNAVEFPGVRAKITFALER